MICDDDKGRTNWKQPQHLPMHMPLKDDIELDRRRLRKQGDDQEWESFCQSFQLDPRGTQTDILVGYSKHFLEEDDDLGGIGYILEHFQKKGEPLPDMENILEHIEKRSGLTMPHLEKPIPLDELDASSTT
jgi:hypothetical protein